MIFKDKTAFTSDPIRLVGSVSRFMVYVTGPGPVAIERQGEDGTWRSYPETTYTKATAQVVTLPRGRYRVVITGGPTTVEIIS